MSNRVKLLWVSKFAHVSNALQLCQQREMNLFNGLTIMIGWSGKKNTLKL
jgi:hypothetical protein